MAVYRKKKNKSPLKLKRFIRVDSKTIIEVDDNLSDEEAINNWKLKLEQSVPSGWSTKHVKI